MQINPDYFAPQGPPPEMLDAVLNLVNGPIVICDVGAADGKDSWGYAMRYPDAKVFAFEPSQRNLIKFVSTVLTPNLSVHACAIGKTEERMDFWESNGEEDYKDWSFSGSLLSPAEHLKHWPQITFQKRSCNVRRLDRCLSSDLPTYLHLDVQGAELNVLDGCGDLLNSIEAIWLEVSTEELYKGQPLVNDVLSYMQSKNFTLSFEGETHAGVQSNQFFIRGSR